MTIEQVTHFWDSRPCNVHHSPVALEEDPEGFSRLVTVRKYRVEPHIWWFSEFLTWKGLRVLDLGCGIGTQTLTFARHGAQVTAVDLSGESLAIAEKRAEATGLEDQVAFYQGDIERLSDFVPIEGYDLVYSFGVLHHTPRPDRAVAEARKYVGDDGIFKLMLYHRYSWRVLQILWRLKGQMGSVDEKVAQFSEAQGNCPITWTYSRKDARTLLRGFKVLGMYVDHIFPYRIPDYVQHRYVREWYWRWMPGYLFHTLESLFGWHLLITARKES